MKKSFAVFGLGRFGESVVRTLVAAHQDVLAVDIEEGPVNELMEVATQTLIADTRDEEVLRDLNIDTFDYVIIGIGNNMEASILTTMLSKEQGAKKVIAKAETSDQGRVLERVGADQVVFPERDMGQGIVRKLLSNHILNFIDLSDEYTLAAIEITDPTFVDQNLIDLNLRQRFGLTVIAIKHAGEINVSPKPTDMMALHDVLTVVGPIKGVSALDAALKK
ncbi:potassium channel family protein [Lactiplantibacillus mudanjiangensis]|uniref:Potassium transporter Trk [Lactobacillus pentosus] n=1 Tax=Lactiplantibacillus mudanjiangensis TaxID=1296538 RepID=A0A660E2V1_9LACO|nr:TrkA family potassium uptake protein [Lactiplantibacillus mudanjiangensis]VDG24446.1 potassium transporter Trk [Lactobacillus pentosus] [Lactiplantibacillus mudanjiangensis]VDG30081.1 potassium transporter Trk [Lactobacillus pentosus] [Lactiplantibacillus mudanjiangensis]VDG30568.1 potassium transporter Trk [Lactobacillus pentosus] [Lactiplantibacillus mudanjiangensis]